jgi:hypothetical protein
MNRLLKFIRLPAVERRLHLEAVLWLGIFRLAISILPFRWLSPALGDQTADVPTMPTERETDIARISKAVVTMGDHLPWKCGCLVQGLSGKTMLRLRGIESALILGLKKETESGLAAHAWLQCGGEILIGKRGTKRFKVISTFT